MLLGLGTGGFLGSSHARDADAAVEYEVGFLARRMVAGRVGVSIVCSAEPRGARGARRAARPVGPFTQLAWSGRGQYLALTVRRRSRIELIVMSFDGKQRTVVTVGGREPSWSPNGRAIAFVKERSIFVTGGSRFSPKPVTRPPSSLQFDHDPQWSRDGSRIFFIRTRVGPIASELLSIRADGSHARTEVAWGDGAAGAWSPDFRERAYVANERIIVASADGSQMRAVTEESPWPPEEPTWSPDGSMIAFLRRPPSRSGARQAADLFVVGADGASETRLTNDPFDEASPSWREGDVKSLGRCVPPR